MRRIVVLLTMFLVVSACVAKPSSSAAGRWPPIRGLTSMGSLAFIRQGGAPANSLAEVNAHPGTYAGVVINATWRDLQPRQAQPLDTSTIDSALRRVDDYNAKYPGTPLVAEVRVFSGFLAPDWVKKLDGGPIAVEKGNSIGLWWKPDYRAAWRALQSSLAARYRDDPRIHEVAITSCGIKGEPFIEPFSLTVVDQFRRAGYKDALGFLCLDEAPDDFAGWNRQALNYAFSPMRCIDSGPPKFCYEYVGRVMHDFRAKFGAEAVIATQGLVAGVRKGREPLYQLIDSAGPPVEFQFFSQAQCTDDAFAEGRRHGLTNLEVWDTTDSGAKVPCNFSAGQLNSMSHALGGR